MTIHLHMDKKQLPYIISLLDDESSTTQRSLASALRAFGDDLALMLDQLDPPISADQRQRIEHLLSRDRQREVQWLDWLTFQDPFIRLESALNYLATVQHGRKYPRTLSDALDELAQEFAQTGHPNNVIDLAHFLFREKGYIGNRADYYNPNNSNLMWVIDQRRGLPISLSVLYMLLGSRVGLEIEGLNFPGHFMARARHENIWYIVDAFNGGDFVNEKEFLMENTGKPELDSSEFDYLAGPELIIGRVLNNLTQAYSRSELPDKLDAIQKLERQMRRKLS